MSSDAAYLQHILDAITAIETYSSTGRNQFEASKMEQDAIIRNFEIIGEATKKLNRTLTALQPSIPWKQIAGMRDLLIHNYMGVDLEAVWNGIVRDLPPLKVAVRKMLASLD